MKTILSLIVIAVILITGCQKKDNPIEATQITPIANWIYRDSNYILVSGLANRRDMFQNNTINGITVLLTDQNINCINSPVSRMEGAWIGVRFPKLETRNYGKTEIQGMMGFWGFVNGQYSSSNISGNFGEAGLTFVDTIGEKRIRGWVSFDGDDFFSEGKTSKVYGSFDIPFCSAVLNSEYYPKVPLSSWKYRDSTYLIVSGIAKRRRSAQGIPENGLVVYLTNQKIICSNSSFNSGATIEIKFPDIATRSYTTGEFEKSFQVYSEYFNASFESIGQIGLTFVDTTNTKKIQGWIAIKRQNTPMIDIYGTFEVPFCSTN